MEITREESTLSQLTSAVCPSKDFEWLTNCMSSYENCLGSKSLKNGTVKIMALFLRNRESLFA